MSNKKIIDQLISAEASLEMTLNQVRRSRKILEGVHPPAPNGGPSLKERVALTVMKNATRKIKNQRS
jgi:hypothetical protein